MANITALRAAALAATPVASSLEYDGESVQLTNQEGVRTPLVKSGAAGAIAAVAVPASGTPYTNAAKTAVQYLIYGGTVTVISVTRAGVTVDVLSQAAAAVAGLAFTLAPGDEFTVTYTAAPTVNAMPL